MKNRVNLFLRNLTSSSSIFPDKKSRELFLEIKDQKGENLMEFNNQNKTNNDNQNNQSKSNNDTQHKTNDLSGRHQFDNDKTFEIRNFSVKNKRCLILDGSQCNTVKMFLSCKKHSRTMKDIIVPNYCSSTFNLILASNICIPYLGSVRAYLDDYCMNDTVKISRNTVENTKGDVDAIRGSFGVNKGVGDNNGDNDDNNDHYVKDDNNDRNNSNIDNRNNVNNNHNDDNDNNDHNDDDSNNNKFGFIYLDYCCRLNAGYKSIEKNPIRDIQCLFEYGLFDIHNTKDDSSDDHNNDNGYEKLEIKNENNKAQNVSVSILAICLCLDEVEEDANEEDIEVEVEVVTTNPENFKHKNDKKTDRKNSKKRKFKYLKTFSKNDSQNIIVGDEKSKSNSDLKSVVLEAAYKYGCRVEVHPERYVRTSN